MNGKQQHRQHQRQQYTVYGYILYCDIHDRKKSELEMATDGIEAKE